MASPQHHNGFTKIANELYDAIARWNLSGYEYRVLLFIIRKTYGWNKKTDKIALSQFVLGTGIRKSHVSRALGLLVKQNIITKGGNRDLRTFTVQKDYEKWVMLPVGERSHHPLVTKGGNSKIPKGVMKKMPKGVISSAKGGNSVVPKGGTTKERYTKYTTTKERREDAPTPKEKAEKFFQGVLDLINGKEVVWLQEFLRELASRNKVQKRQIWDETRNFCSWWTEKNSTGTRERWQMQKTFEVDRRLLTWFRRARMITFTVRKARGREIIGLD